MKVRFASRYSLYKNTEKREKIEKCKLFLIRTICSKNLKEFRGVLETSFSLVFS